MQTAYYLSQSVAKFCIQEILSTTFIATSHLKTGKSTLCQCISIQI